jgi:uncharacterized protein
MTAYLDTSALAKVYVHDEGTTLDLMGIIESFGSVTTSRLTFVETRAALAAARRAGRLTARGHDAAVDDLVAVWTTTIHIIDLSQEVAMDAGEVAETFGLRAADAIHLASLRALDASAVPLVAWDVRLRTAALANGFACYPAAI